MKFTSFVAMTALLAGALQSPARADASCQGMAFPASLEIGENDSLATGNAIRQWLGGTISETFTYSFTQAGPIPKPCAFNEAAWAKFRSHAGLGKYEAKVKDIQALGWPVLEQPPRIRASGVVATGEYLWKVEVNIVPWLETMSEHTPESTRTIHMVLAKDRGGHGETSWRVVDVL